MGQKIGLLTASQRQRIEAAEMKLLRPLAGYKTNEYRRNWFQHLQRMPQN